MPYPFQLYDMIMSDKPPNQLCLGYMDQVSYTYDSLLQQVEACAMRLVAHGVDQGSSIAVNIPNSLTSIILLLATWKLNAHLVLLDSRLKQSEVERNLAAYKPNYVVKAPPHQSVFSNFTAEVEFEIESLHQAHPSHPEQALVLFTSGSTGSPKVVGRTVASIQEELRNFLSFTGSVRPNEHVMVLCSISHSFGLLTGVITSLYRGAAITLCSSRAPDIIRIARHHKAAIMYGVPFHFETMTMIHEQRIHLPSLRSAVCAGEPLKHETHHLFLEKYGLSVGQLYGMSETGTLAADLLGAAPGTVGEVMKGKTIRIVEGELSVRLPCLPYVGTAGSERYQDGWLLTQDIGEFDRNGRLRHLGRRDSLVNIGGRKVYLQEVEEKLRTYGGIQEVLVVYEGGMRAYFTVNRPLDMRSFAAWCQDELSNYKVPKSYVNVEAFPRTSTGKLLRKQLDQLRVKEEFML